MRLFGVNTRVCYRRILFCVCSLVAFSIVLIANRLNLLSETAKKISIGRLSIGVRDIEEKDTTEGKKGTTGDKPFTDEKTTMLEIGLIDRNVTLGYSDGDENMELRPTILLWNPLQFPSTTIPEVASCGGGCKLTSNRNEFHRSDAVIFTMKELDLTDLPDKSWRRPDQVYIWWCEESAWASKNFYKKRLGKIAHNYFNWTMTYKSDSDVNAMMIPYAARNFVLQRMEEYRKLHPEFPERSHSFSDEVVYSKEKTAREILTVKKKAAESLQRKVKMAAWVASNCGYTAGAVLRRDIVTRLQFLGLSVDIYGSCGNRDVPEALSEFAEILSGYRFYLAFENALHCHEYITEKFWYNSLYAGVVPVVWGAVKSDFEAVAPPNSFIHYDDFGSDKVLVDYLIRLREDDKLFMKYFEWWWESPGYFPVLGVTEIQEDVLGRSAMYDFEMNAFCHLCSLLSKGSHKKVKRSIPSLHDWWYKNESQVCLSATHNAKMRVFRGDSTKKGYKIIQI